jgi:hypothetical protein
MIALPSPPRAAAIVAALLLVGAPAAHADPAPGVDRRVERLWQGLAGPRVAIAVRSNVSATLQRSIGRPQAGDRAAAHLICETPCLLRLPIGDTSPYRLDADGMQPTPWFALPQGDATIAGRLVGAGWREWPPALTALGVVTALLGGTGLLLHQTDVLDGAGWKGASVGLLGLAGVCLGTALGLWWLGPHSTATITLR